MNDPEKEFLLQLNEMASAGPIEYVAPSRQYRGLSRSSMPWSWMKKKSNTEENGAFVGVRKFEGPQNLTCEDQSLWGR